MSLRDDLLRVGSLSGKTLHDIQAMPAGELDAVEASLARMTERARAARRCVDGTCGEQECDRCWCDDHARPRPVGRCGCG